MLMQEINIMKNFNSKNIVKFKEFFESEYNFYIIVEFCECDLRFYLKNKNIEENEAIKIMIDLLNGF